MDWLGRMRFLGSDAIDAGRRKLEKAGDVAIYSETVKGVVHQAIVGGYPVVRVEMFAYCGCPDFKFGRGEACKHIARIWPLKCGKCWQDVKTHGLCRGCGIESAIYLKERPERPVEIIGGVRI